MMNDASPHLDPQRLRRRLEGRRAELVEAADTRAEAARTVELDQQRNGRLTRMDALQGQAMAQARSERAQREVVRIDAALRRLDADTYGECLHCGELIAAGRLWADPAAALCIDCAEAADRSG